MRMDIRQERLENENDTRKNNVIIHGLKIETEYHTELENLIGTYMKH